MIFIGFILTISCTSEKKKYQQNFEKNFAALDSLKNYVNQKVGEIVNKDTSQKFILLFTLEPRYSPHKNIIYDPYLVTRMKALNIEQIRCITENESVCGSFGVIHFQLMTAEYPTDKVVCFVFDKCDGFKNYESKTIFQMKFKKYWGLFIDRS